MDGDYIDDLMSSEGNVNYYFLPLNWLITYSLIVHLSNIKLTANDSKVFVCIFAVFAPLLRLSPPPTDKDYYFNLDDSEGVCDLFDVPLM